MFNLGFTTFITSLWPVFAALHLLAWGYNWLTQQLEIRRYSDGAASLLVVGGVILTVTPPVLAGANVTMTGLDWGLVMLVAFAATGSPMVLGSLYREARKRERARHELALLNGINGLKRE